jgi:hypothetical protein
MAQHTQRHEEKGLKKKHLIYSLGYKEDTMTRKGLHMT